MSYYHINHSNSFETITTCGICKKKLKDKIICSNIKSLSGHFHPACFEKKVRKNLEEWEKQTLNILGQKDNAIEFWEDVLKCCKKVRGERKKKEVKE